VKRDFSLLTTRQFDLLVCGGGIYGAWTAYDAALRGLSVAIIEQDDWACATSSASSKLIHGGLRYLETYDFKLVRKALAERQMLLQIAPHRVWPLRFGVPVYTDSRVGTLRLKAGLTLYDFFSGIPSRDMRHRYFRRKLFSEHFASLDMTGMKGGFTYGDAQTDDARLVLELIAGAQDAGAVCVNYCKLTGFTEQHGQASGALIHDRLTGTCAEISAKQIVNTTGQWIAAAVHGRDWCRLSKGVHLVMPSLSMDDALLLTAKSDGRVFFMIPWYGMTLLGTTDTDYQGDLESVKVEPEEVAYLLDAANHYLKTAWSESDVIGSYAGVRVMKRSSESLPSEVSRDWELKTASNGVHYSIGGKITSSREDAACIVNAVCVKLEVDVPCPTMSRPFPWVPQEQYKKWSEAFIARAMLQGVDQESAMWLCRRHGKRADEVLRKVADDSELADRIIPALPFIYADLLHCACDEMVIHLHDLLRRRMPLLVLARLSENDLYRIAATVSPVMGWDEGAVKREVDSCRQ